MRSSFPRGSGEIVKWLWRWERTESSSRWVFRFGVGYGNVSAAGGSEDFEVDAEKVKGRRNIGFARGAIRSAVGARMARIDNRRSGVRARRDIILEFKKQDEFWFSEW